MAYKFKYLEKIVGSFIVISLIVLIGTIILIARGKNLNPFEKKHFYRTYFNKGTGLSEGISVMLNGVKIGNVTKMRLNDENKIDIFFIVQKEYINRIKKDAIARVNAPLIGSKTVEILPGSEGAPMVPDNDYVVSVDSDKGKELLKARPADDILMEIAQNLEQLTFSLKDPRGPLLSSMQNVNLILGSIAENRASLEETIQSFARISKNLEAVSKSLKENPLLGGQKKQVKSTSPATIDLNERTSQYK